MEGEHLKVALVNSLSPEWRQGSGRRVVPGSPPHRMRRSDPEAPAGLLGWFRQLMPKEAGTSAPRLPNERAWHAVGQKYHRAPRDMKRLNH